MKYVYLLKLQKAGGSEMYFNLKKYSGPNVGLW